MNQVEIVKEVYCSTPVFLCCIVSLILFLKQWLVKRGLVSTISTPSYVQMTYTGVIKGNHYCILP